MSAGRPDISSEFRAAMADAGVDPDSERLIANGKIHRFRGPGDKPGRRNCWYVLFDSGAGKFGSWRLGVEQTWGARGNDERSRNESDGGRFEEARRQMEAERERRRSEAAIKAQRL
jgi:putative DNA primase/helicase